MRRQHRPSPSLCSTSPRCVCVCAAERDLVSRDFHYFLTRSHKIYDKYLKLGSPLRVRRPLPFHHALMPRMHTLSREVY